MTEGTGAQRHDANPHSGALPRLHLDALIALERKYCRTCARPERWDTFLQHGGGRELKFGIAPLCHFGKLFSEMIHDYRHRAQNKIFQAVSNDYKPTTITAICKGLSPLKSPAHIESILRVIIFGTQTAPQPSEQFNHIASRVINFFVHSKGNARAHYFDRDVQHFLDPSLQACGHPSCYPESMSLYVRMLESIEIAKKNSVVAPSEEQLGHVYLISGNARFASSFDATGTESNSQPPRIPSSVAAFQNIIAECVSAGMRLTFVVRAGTEASASAKLAKKQIESLAQNFSAPPEFGTQGKSLGDSQQIAIVRIQREVDQILEPKPTLVKHAGSGREDDVRPKIQRAGAERRLRYYSEYLGGIFRYALFVWPGRRDDAYAFERPSIETETATLLVLRSHTHETRVLRAFEPEREEVNDCRDWIERVIRQETQTQSEGGKRGKKRE